MNTVLPPGWTSASIETLCEVNPRDTHPPDDETVSFVPMAAVSELDGTIVEAETKRVAEVKKGFTSFSNGDVIFAKITPCMENGKSAVASALVGGRAYGSTEFFVMRSRGGVSAEFLHAFVRQESYRRAARGTMQSGVGQARVPKAFVEQSVLPVPPLAEQRRIVEKLDGLRARSRRAREALDEVPALLEQLKQSVLAAAFRGDLTAVWRAAHPDVEPAHVLLDRLRAERRRRWEESNPRKKYVEPSDVDRTSRSAIPSTWSWATLEELTPATAPIVYGIIQPGPHVVDGVPFVRPADIEDSTVVVAALPRTSPEIAEAYQRAALEPGDVVFSIVGTIGKWLVVPSELRGANITQSSVRLRPLSSLGAMFYVHVLRAPTVVAQMERLMFGNAVQRLNVDHVRKLVVPVMPVDEWAMVQARIDSVIEIARAARLGTRSARLELDTLDQALLAKAFRGELVPQDPSDEPASALLARIKAAAEAKAR